MAKKPTKTTAKKSPTKVRDLSARKDPKGGAQKRENPALGGGTTRTRSTSRAGSRTT